MAIVLADVGADEFLKIIFNNDWAAAGSKDLTLKLYTNNYIPLDTSVAGDFTEASGGGYSAATLANGSWTVDTGHNPSDAVYAEQTWTFTGALSASATIYGYFVVDADGTLILAEKFDYSFTPAKNGDQLRLTPKIQLSKGTPS
jgi:hypothetical protein